MVAHYNAAGGLFGLSASPAGLEASPVLGSLSVLQTVALFEPLTDHLPGRVRLVGSCLHEPEPPDAELVEWLDGAGPLVYVQHGSVFRAGDTFWPALDAASDELGLRVAASMERLRGAPPASRDARRLLRGHVPQASVLEQARAVVGSANTTAVLGAITHGLPLLVFPTGGEQPALATRLAAVGAAAVLSASAPSSDGLATLKRVLDDGAEREAARRLRAAFAAYAGPRFVAPPPHSLPIPPLATRA